MSERQWRFIAEVEVYTANGWIERTTRPLTITATSEDSARAQLDDAAYDTLLERERCDLAFVKVRSAGLQEEAPAEVAPEGEVIVPLAFPHLLSRRSP